MSKKTEEDLSSTENVNRKLRKRKIKAVTRTYRLAPRGKKPSTTIKTSVTSPEIAENLSIVQEMTRSFINTIDFYKSDQGGSNPHDESVKRALSMSEWRREYVEGLLPEDITWAHLAAVAEVNMADALELWARIRQTADDELEGGRRASKVTGGNTEPCALAQFLAIRDHLPINGSRTVELNRR